MTIAAFLRRIKMYFKRYAATKTISKMSLAQWLKSVIDTLQLIDNGYNQLSDVDKVKFKETIINKLQYVNDPFVKKIINEYVKRLNNKAFIIESKGFLSSFITTNKKLLSVLQKVNDNLNQFFKNESVQVGQVKLSQMSILGIISQAQKFGEFTVYFLSILFDIASLQSGMSYNPPKFKVAILKQNYDLAINTINDVLNKTKGFDFLKELKAEYTPSYDFTLGVISNHASVVDSILAKIFRRSTIIFGLTQGFLGLNIISTALDLYQQYLYNRYQHNKTLKEWMEQRVALLKMELNRQQDIGKRERLQKIISRYEDLIAKYDRKIRDYETEFEEE